jgi:uncharacterized protein YecE (DUF72 family)
VKGVAKKNVKIGTSGFYYDHWTGRFYPEELNKKDWFGYYQKYFDTVELNNTFYHLPKESTVKGWNDNSGKDFIFSVKASRFITHIKLLKEPSEPLERFFKIMSPLKAKTGPVLFQLPGRFKKNTDRLKDFLNSLAKYDVLKVFEFRNPTWWDDDVYEILRTNNACFCWYSMPGDIPPEIVTTDFLYIRMHGGSQLYGSRYSDGELEKIAKKIYKRNIKNIYVYFNNDYNAYAVENALKLREVLNVTR